MARGDSKAMIDLRPIPCGSMISSAPEILFRDRLLVMKVTGPNEVPEFHVNESPEILFQWKGKATIELWIDGKVVPVEIPEGHAFVIPARIPHRPVREAGTIGLVVESAEPGIGSRYIPVPAEAAAQP